MPEKQMKKMILPLSLLLLLISSVLIYLWIDRAMKSSYTALVRGEIGEIRTVPTEQLKPKPTRFTADFVITEWADGAIDFEVNVSKPKAPMYRVTVSAFLGEQMLNGVDPQTFFYANRSLVTNVVQVQDEDPSLGLFNLFPNGEVREITVSSGQIRYKLSSFNEVIGRLPFVVVKVSWQDDKKRTQAEYFKITKDQYVIKKMYKK